LRSIWDLYARVYDSIPRHFKPYQELVQEVVSEVGKCPHGGRVLDVGCGTGTYSVTLAKAGYDVTGIDYSDSMLARATKHGSNIAGKVHFIKSNLTDRLPYTDDSFDCVISVHSLYTIKETGRVLKEYYRVLRPGGRFVLAEPRYPVKLIPCLKEAKKRNGLKGAAIAFSSLFLPGIINLIIAERQATGFYHYFNEYEIRERLSEAGFTIVSVRETYIDNMDLMAISHKT
jgi:ubiquinone/menaquinone biosynthesis C-methylase UbiE